MKKCICFLLFLVIVSEGYAAPLPAYKDSIPAAGYRVAIIAPVYLDSLFTGSYYRYGKKFPRFMVPGVEFFQGAEVALDSMANPAIPVRVSFYDCTSAGQEVESLIANRKLDQCNLIIGSVRDADFINLARFSSEHQIPFISATYPNDGGITNNPFLVILNSTLRTHCESIFSYLLQQSSDNNILLCRQPGSQEERVHGYFTAINHPDDEQLLNMHSINISDSNFLSIQSKLDSTRMNFVVAESLDEYFAGRLADACYQLSKSYQIKLIGMPNWDGFKSITKSHALKDFPVYFTTPFYTPRWEENQTNPLKELYLYKYKGNPTDFSYKGYECVALFLPLLMTYPDDFTSHLNDYGKTVFTEFFFKPVINPETRLPDYFENKHLYFMQIKNGSISRAW